MDKPEALRLADVIMGTPCWADLGAAAAELRRLSALNGELTENLEKKSVAIQRIWKERDELLKVNAELLEALRRIADPRNIHFAGDAQVVARAAIARAEGEKV